MYISTTDCYIVYCSNSPKRLTVQRVEQAEQTTGRAHARHAELRLTTAALLNQIITEIRTTVNTSAAK